MQSDHDVMTEMVREAIMVKQVHNMLGKDLHNTMHQAARTQLASIFFVQFTQMSNSSLRQAKLKH